MKKSYVKQYYAQALFELLKKKPLQEISITDLVKKAGASRASFYRNYTSKEQIIEKWESFSGEPQKLNLPSAPKQFIRYMEEENRPQVSLDVDFEHGMGVSMGRLREDTLFDYKFVGLSHNTIRGAAGGAVLCAELLTAKGYISKK